MTWALMSALWAVLAYYAGRWVTRSDGTSDELRVAREEIEALRAALAFYRHGEDVEIERRPPN